MVGGVRAEEVERYPRRWQAREGLEREVRRLRHHQAAQEADAQAALAGRRLQAAKRGEVETQLVRREPRRLHPESQEPLVHRARQRQASGGGAAGLLQGAGAPQRLRALAVVGRRPPPPAAPPRRKGRTTPEGSRRASARASLAPPAPATPAIDPAMAASPRQPMQPSGSGPAQRRRSRSRSWPR